MKRRDCPGNVVVKDTDYAVKFVRRFRDRLQIGEFDPGGEILIKQGLSEYDRLETLVHEIFHAFEEEYRIKMPHKLIKKLEKPVAEFIYTNFFKKKRKK